MTSCENSCEPLRVTNSVSVNEPSYVHSSGGLHKPVELIACEISHGSSMVDSNKMSHKQLCEIKNVTHELLYVPYRTVLNELKNAKINHVAYEKSDSTINKMLTETADIICSDKQDKTSSVVVNHVPLKKPLDLVVSDVSCEQTSKFSERGYNKQMVIELVTGLARHHSLDLTGSGTYSSAKKAELEHKSQQRIQN